VTPNRSQARRLKTGKWRIYETEPDLRAARDPASGSIPSFDSLEKARDWWGRLRPEEEPLEEAPKCARCGGYFGRNAAAIPYQGRVYHEAHLPERRTAEGNGAWSRMA